MKWLFICMWLGFLPTKSAAENIVVRSGEHADFSRIVIKVENPGDWQFRKIEGGYDFRSKISEQFDIAQVFQFIPRTRIRNISPNRFGGLFFEVSCICHADAFELREGRIVFDFKDGPPEPNSVFETLFTKEVSETIRKSIEIKSDQRDELEITKAKKGENIQNLAIQTSTKKNINKIQNKFQGVRPSLANVQTSENTIGRSISVGTGVPIDRSEIRDKYLQNLETASRNLIFPILLPVENSFNNSDEKKILSLEDRDKVQSFDNLSKAKKIELEKLQKSNFTQTALLKKLQKAVAQGLIQIPITKPETLSRESTKFKYHSALEIPSRETLSIISSNNHIQINTSADSMANQINDVENLDDMGRECLPLDYFEVRDWGMGENIGFPFGNLWTTIVGEFDELDQENLVKLVRRQIYLGFGAEGKSLVQAFSVSSIEFDILVELAAVMDGNKLAAPSILRSQLSCQNSAALWAMLAFEILPLGEFLDVNSIARTFSGLPIHLRELIGPNVVERFLDKGEIDAASTIRNMIERTDVVQSDTSKIIEANIAVGSQKNDEAIKLLTLIVEGNGPKSASALARIIELQIEAGLPINSSDAEFADVLAVEHRGTLLGKRLLQAAIFGFSANSKNQTSFDRISTALLNSDISLVEAERLRAQSHIQNVENSSDETFLIVAYNNNFDISDSQDFSRRARTSVAQRLLNLGFSEDAKTVLSGITVPYQQQERLLLAKIAIKEKKPNLVEAYLKGGEDRPSKILLARANELKFQFGSSAMSYGDLGMLADQQRSAWLDANLTLVASLRGGKNKSAAKIILDQNKLNSTNANIESTRQVSKNVHKKSTILIDSKTLLNQSKKFGSIFRNLLKVSPN